MEAVTDAQGNITDVRLAYPVDFVGQMLRYGRMHSFLPDVN
jgi:dipeptidyl-peptidase-3